MHADLEPRTMNASRFAFILAAALASTAAGAADVDPPVIFHKPPAAAIVGQPLEIVAEIKDPSGVFGPTLYYRKPGTAKFASAAMNEAGGKFSATIPATAVTGDLDYFIEAFDNEGNGPARKGTPEKPLKVDFTRPGDGQTLRTEDDEDLVTPGIQYTVRAATENFSSGSEAALKVGDAEPATAGIAANGAVDLMP